MERIMADILHASELLCFVCGQPGTLAHLSGSTVKLERICKPATETAAADADRQLQKAVGSAMSTN
jgi:hypothetical protein